MVAFSGPPSTAIRNKPITDELKQLLQSAAQTVGIDAIRINSGGQDALGEGTRRTGSTRHDRGRAADIQCLVGTKTLTFTDEAADPVIVSFVTAAAAAGAVGIGAGVAYMGNRTIHVGFGTSVDDHRTLTWGAGGLSAKAPKWLQDAAKAGWTATGPAVAHPATPEVVKLGNYVVIARNGLRLRGGPGTNFDIEKSLPAGTPVTVIAVSTVDPAWVRVDLEGDGLLDGYVFAAFLAPADSFDGNENAPEPGAADGA